MRSARGCEANLDCVAQCFQEAQKQERTSTTPRGPQAGRVAADASVRCCRGLNPFVGMAVVSKSDADMCQPGQPDVIIRRASFLTK